MIEPINSIIWTISMTLLLCLGGFVPGALIVWLVMRRRQGLKPAAVLGSVVALFVLAVSNILMIESDIGRIGLGYIFATLVAAGLQLAGVVTLSLLLRERYQRSDV